MLFLVQKYKKFIFTFIHFSACFWIRICVWFSCCVPVAPRSELPVQNLLYPTVTIANQRLQRNQSIAYHCVEEVRIARTLDEQNFLLIHSFTHRMYSIYEKGRNVIVYCYMYIFASRRLAFNCAYYAIELAIYTKSFVPMFCVDLNNIENKYRRRESSRAAHIQQHPASGDLKASFSR